MMGCPSDMWILVEVALVLHPEAERVALVTLCLADLASRSSHPPHLPIQRLCQILQVIYLTGYCIYAGRAGD